MKSTTSKNSNRTRIASGTLDPGFGSTDDSDRERWSNRIHNAFRLESRTPRLVEINGDSVTMGGRRTVIPPIGDPVWTQLAQRLIEEGIDGVEFVIVWFSCWKGPEDLLHPRQLLDERLIERFADERVNHIYKYQYSPTALQRQKDYARMRVWQTRQWAPDKTSERKGWLVALSTHPGLSPLYRYGKALQMKSRDFDEIAAEYEVEAAIEYIRNQTALDEHWGDFIPADFKEHVVPELYGEVFDEGRIPAAKPIIFDPWRF